MKKNTSVATLGPVGSYHSIATKKLCSDCNIIYQESFSNIFKVLLGGEVNLAIIAVSNSTTGRIKETQELIKNYDKKIEIIDTLNLNINHALIALKESNLDKIDTVISHPQAIKQCSEFINLHNLKTINTKSTTAAIKIITEQNNTNLAAIAAKQSIINTKIIAKQIQNNTLRGTGKNNKTKFIKIRLKNFVVN